MKEMILLSEIQRFKFPFGNEDIKVNNECLEREKGREIEWFDASFLNISDNEYVSLVIVGPW